MRFHEKRRAHALVIPVINEGERIRGQLERIRDADLPVDVIVADGGSTDGSEASTEEALPAAHLPHMLELSERATLLGARNRRLRRAMQASAHRPPAHLILAHHSVP